MENNPIVTVIIPTYNRVAKVGKAIESALKQTYAHKQIVVIDDGSTDNTAELMKKYPEVEYIIQDHGGQAAARNNGLSRAKGKYIASLDSDDTWNSNFLASCVEELEKNNLDFVWANWSQDAGNGKWIDPFESYSFFKPFLENRNEYWNILSDKELRWLYINGCPSPSSSLVMRRTSLKSTWTETLSIADDWCIIMDMIFANQCRAAFTKDKLWFKHIDGTNIHDGRDENEILQHLYVYDKEIMYKRYHKKFNREERKQYRESLVYYLTIYAFQQLTIYRSYNSSMKFFRKAIFTDPKSTLSLVAYEIRERTKKYFIKEVDTKTV